ncbi:amidohydrolase family protein [Comamonas kerstersii]|uniref:Amidohydrolase family protein n=1 Tax=Comamonas kerstersii TaxID=225992 RepID=A0A6A1R873_9BURK|nr:amidohydrolase family protein [Comamonas kerstersii]KAB0588889.1 amidohydrolase family protein [Comamonas kerstersii]
MPSPQLTYTLHPSRPAIQLPVNACDSHVHVFGPQSTFPFAANRSFTPADASKEQLFALHKHLGITRCVIVQSACHGFDNTVVADAIAAGQGNYLGIALVPPTVSVQDLKQLADTGFRGIRFNFMRHLDTGVTIEDVVALTPRLADLGMHLQVHFESRLVHALAPVLQQAACDVVVDHMGRVDASQGIQGEDFQGLLRLLESPKLFVKVSGIDRVDPHAPYLQGVELARTLVQHFPDRCLWGSDWPHPNHTHIPDDGVLVSQIAAIAPTDTALQRLLVTNPERLYRF